MATFTEQLAAAKRTAQISGRPITKQEVSGIAAGSAESASARLARSKGLEFEERRVDISEEAAETQKSQFAKTLAQRREETRLEVAAAESAAKREEKQQRQTTVIATTALGAYVASGTAVGGPVGAGVGLLIGLAATSFICTATNEAAGLTGYENRALLRFRHYVKTNHRNVLEFYLEVGPEIVKAIGNDKAFYENIKENMIMPVIIHSESSHQEQAFWIYRTWIVKLIKKYTPHLLERAKEVVRNDKIKFKEAA